MDNKIGVAQLEKIIAKTNSLKNSAVGWQPFLLGALGKALGVYSSSDRLDPKLIHKSMLNSIKSTSKLTEVIELPPKIYEKIQYLVKMQEKISKLETQSNAKKDGIDPKKNVELHRDLMNTDIADLKKELETFCKKDVIENKPASNRLGS